MPWYDDRPKLVELLAWMKEQGEFKTTEEVIYVVERPWCFNARWQDMRAEQAEVEREELAS